MPHIQVCMLERPSKPAQVLERREQRVLDDALAQLAVAADAVEHELVQRIEEALEQRPRAASRSPPMMRSRSSRSDWW
jgi:hypothetical protein